MTCYSSTHLGILIDHVQVQPADGSASRILALSQPCSGTKGFQSIAVSGVSNTVYLGCQGAVLAVDASSSCKTPCSVGGDGVCICSSSTSGDGPRWLLIGIIAGAMAVAIAIGIAGILLRRALLRRTIAPKPGAVITSNSATHAYASQASPYQMSPIQPYQVGSPLQPQQQNWNQQQWQPRVQGIPHSHIQMVSSPEGGPLSVNNCV